MGPLKPENLALGQNIIKRPAFALSRPDQENPLNFYLNYRIKMIARVSLNSVSRNCGNEGASLAGDVGRENRRTVHV